MGCPKDRRCPLSWYANRIYFSRLQPPPQTKGTDG